MKCPQCNNDFTLTWKRYLKTPLGRLTCPLCQTKLTGGHRWFYWPFLFLVSAVVGVPLAILGGSRYDLVGIVTGWILGATVIVIPFDKFLEGKFAVLKERKDKTSNKLTENNIRYTSL